MNLVVEQTDRILPEHLPDGCLSVVVFGPGTGEAILVRLPGGEVGVVDGCKLAKQSEDPVSSLLTGLGVQRLTFACLTHPHEDHFAGLAEVIKKFNPEHLIWAGTEHERLLDRFAVAFRKSQTANDAIADGVPPRELEDLVSEFVKRSQRKRKKMPDSRAQTLSDHKLLFTKAGQRAPVELWGVLPTTTALHRALGKNATVGPAPTADQEPVLSETDPNEISGALLLRWADASVLLAGDSLLGRADHHEGWAAADWIHAPVQIVKVAHHASSGAHSADLWQRMQPSVALVTPFKNAAGKQPPQEEMLRELSTRTDVLVVTSCPNWWPGTGTVRAEPIWEQTPPVAGTPLANSKPAIHGYGAAAISIDAAGLLKRAVLAGSARRVRPNA